MTSQPPASVKFHSREDAAWRVLGFAVFWGAAAVFGLSMLRSGDHLAAPLVPPIVSLVIAGAVILELALRRLQANLTNKRMAPWPLGMVSLAKIGRALAPSTLFEAADRIGLDRRAVAASL